MKKNQFPLEIFPANIMEFVDEANKCYGYNKDFFASAILTAVNRVCSSMAYSSQRFFNSSNTISFIALRLPFHSQHTCIQKRRPFTFSASLSRNQAH